MFPKRFGGLAVLFESLHFRQTSIVKRFQQFCQKKQSIDLIKFGNAFLINAIRGWFQSRILEWNTQTVPSKVKINVFECSLWMLFSNDYWTLKTYRSLWPAESDPCRSHTKSCRTVTDDRRLFHALPLYTGGSNSSKWCMQCANTTLWVLP